jgi:hypothetical protein
MLKKLKEANNHIDLTRNKVNISCHTGAKIIMHNKRMELLAHLFFSIAN